MWSLQSAQVCSHLQLASVYYCGLHLHKWGLKPDSSPQGNGLESSEYAPRRLERRLVSRFSHLDVHLTPQGTPIPCICPHANLSVLYPYLPSAHTCFLNFILCVWVFCTQCPMPAEAQRSYGHLWATMWVLGIEPGSSRRTASALNSSTIF